MHDRAHDDRIERARAVKIEDVLSQRGILTTLKGRNGKLAGPCPKCGGDDRFAVNCGKQAFICRQCFPEDGGDAISLVMFLEDCDFLTAVEILTGQRKPKPKGGNGAIKRDNVLDFNTAKTQRDAGLERDAAEEAKTGQPAEYIYQLADGTPHLKVRRYYVKGKKKFAANHWTGSAWESGAPVGPVIPYRLPELLSADTVFVVEGEKNCDDLGKLGPVATTNPFGAGKWTDELNSHFEGKAVFILPDNDQPGADHARDVATRLTRIAREVRVVPLPGLPHKGDVSDWIERGGTINQLFELAQAAPIFDPAAATEQPEAAEQPEATQQPKVSPIPLTFFDDCGTVVQKRHILKGFLARGETSAIIGPPGVGKSALAAEIVIHCDGSKPDWRGYKCKERCGVVVFALERSDLYKRRFEAYKQRDGLNGLPVAVASAVIDLLDPSCIDIIGLTVRAAEEKFGCSVGLIVIDSFSKGLAAGGGDEDKARDQNRAAAHLRTVQQYLDLHVLLVGHTGKDETRGARGSNAHLADVDVMVQITTDGDVKTATIIKANDGPEGVLTSYQLEIVKLGTDEDGDDITTALISNEPVADKPQAKTRRGLTGAQSRALELLVRCINDDGRPPPPSNEYPQNVQVVRLGDWAAMCERGGLSSAEKKDDRAKAFRRAKDDLQTMRRIACLDGWVWLALDLNGV